MNLDFYHNFNWCTSPRIPFAGFQVFSLVDFSRVKNYILNLRLNKSWFGMDKWLRKVAEKVDIDVINEARERLARAWNFKPVDRPPLIVNCPPPISWPRFKHIETFYDKDKMLISQLTSVYSHCLLRDAQSGAAGLGLWIQAFKPCRYKTDQCIYIRWKKKNKKESLQHPHRPRHLEGSQRKRLKYQPDL